MNLLRHNSHYWSDENPYWVRSIDNQHRWSVNVWCGIVDSKIIGPHFFEETLNGERYLQFLREDLPALFDDVSYETRMNMWFQQDGAPPHFARLVRNYLNEQYPQKWIGRGGPVEWPPRSPDLTSPDFFLWGYLKDVVFREPPTTRDDMKVRITEACRAITPAMLEATVRNFKKRVRLCIRENGGHFEHIIKY